MIICVLILKQILHKKKVIFIQLIESPILPYLLFCKYIFGQLLKWTEFVIICRIKSSTVPISLRVLNNIVEKPSSSIVFTSWILQRVWMSAAAAVDLNWVSEAPLPNTLLMVLMSSCILLPIPIPIPILCWWCWCHPAICILRPIPIPNWVSLIPILCWWCWCHPAFSFYSTSPGVSWCLQFHIELVDKRGISTSITLCPVFWHMNLWWGNYQIYQLSYFYADICSAFLIAVCGSGHVTHKTYQVKQSRN